MLLNVRPNPPAMPDEPPDELMRDRMEQTDFDRILTWLRKADSAERVSFICRWSHLPPLITRLATSAINNPGESLSIAETAFDAITHADSQRTKLWCQFAVTKLGPRKTIHLLRERFATRPHVVDMACYWLPTMISREDAIFTELQALSRDADSAGIIRPAVTSTSPTGQTLFHDRYEDTSPKA